MTLLCGIDEAGRGPIIGPLVMCGIVIKESDEAKLKTIKVKDSKLLPRAQREKLFDQILKIVYKHKILIIDSGEIDNAVNNHDGLNLNWLEANKSCEIINELNPKRYNNKGVKQTRSQASFFLIFKS